MIQEEGQSFREYCMLVEAVWRRRLFCAGAIESNGESCAFILSLQAKGIEIFDKNAPIDVAFVEGAMGLRESWMARKFSGQSVFDPTDYAWGSGMVMRHWFDGWVEGEWVENGPQDPDWPVEFPIRCVVGRVPASVAGWACSDLFFVGYQRRQIELDGSAGPCNDKFVVAGFSPIQDGEDLVVVMTNLARYAMERHLPESRVHAATMPLYEALRNDSTGQSSIRDKWRAELASGNCRTMKCDTFEIPRSQMPRHELEWIGTSQLPGCLDLDGVRFDVNSCEGWGQVELMDDNVQRQLETLMARGWNVEQIKSMLGEANCERCL